ncbi:MAG: 50S ribosomal protein L3 [Candidatus Dadabacteria bacterium RBG_19FT_COMBO_40_33]|nr:MAG: 50S ribosomal protein L3 [Candidatus Dadabacteria bacterium RBG_19FT_COMBO_40_33]
MIEGLIGRKVGMTEVFLEDGTLIAGTVIKAGPCFVVQKRSLERDGYEAIQIGFEEVKPHRETKALLGHFKKAGIPPVRILMEFEVLKGKVDDYKSGDVIKADIFKEGDIIDISGTSKGKGFAGVMKRHGFSGQPDSHGGMSHRKPGSIGQHSYPARVWKGIKMPGHMGAERVTMQGLRVIKVETEKDIVLVKGSVPGPDGGLVILKHTTRGRVKSGTV